MNCKCIQNCHAHLFQYLEFDVIIKIIQQIIDLYAHRAAQLAKGMLAFGIFITHGLACYVAIDITWTDYVEKKVGNSPRKLLWEYVVRTLLVLVTCKKKSPFDKDTIGLLDIHCILLFSSFLISFIGRCNPKSWIVHIIVWCILFVCTWLSISSGKFDIFLFVRKKKREEIFNQFQQFIFTCFSHLRWSNIVHSIARQLVLQRQ